ncbi:MAG: mobile mystery protein A [Bacteriovoracaceae bacterium]
MKTIADLKMMRRQVGKKLEELTPFKKITKGIPSWTRYIRLALGMSVSQLAARAKLSQNTISQIEKNEVEGKINLNTLKKMAEAMDCDFVYAFVPKVSLEQTILNQARKKVSTTMTKAETHMELEDQKVKVSKAERMQELIEEKIYSKYLWEEE